MFTGAVHDVVGVIRWDCPLDRKTRGRESFPLVGHLKVVVRHGLDGLVETDFW